MNSEFVSLLHKAVASTGTIGSATSVLADKSGFAEISSCGSSGSYSSFDSTESMTSSRIIGNIITIIALYLAFKCKTKTGGIDLVQMLIACCCSPCYIVYRLVKPCVNSI